MSRHLRLGLFGTLLAWACLAGAPAVRSQTAPKLTSTTPANGANDVAVTSSLVFVFDQAMDVDVVIIPSLPPFLIGNLEMTPAGLVSPMSCEWSGDGRTLTCESTGELPSNTTLGWTLNPAGALFPIGSADGVELATTSGSFTTGDGGGGSGEDAPKLLAAVPADGATAVSVATSVVFVFDQPMIKNPALGGFPPTIPGAVVWTGTGVDGTKFTYVWSTDGTSLTCNYAGDLPGNTAVSWVLNPAASPVKLESDIDTPLPLATTSGAFTTGEGGSGECDPDGTPDSWGAFGVIKQGTYRQTSAADPMPIAESPFSFNAFVTSPDTGATATAGSVTLPNGTRQDLEASPVGGFLFISDEQATESALDTAYPAGNYTLRFTQTGQPERTIPMPFSAANPPVPKIANHAAAQAVNPAQDFTLQWNAFTGAAGNDAISLTIWDGLAGVIFQAPDPCVPRELPAAATSIVIPAGTLETNKTYSAVLDFSRQAYFSTNTVPEMVGFGGTTRGTEFEIKTGTGGGPGPADPAFFTAYRLLPNGNPEMHLTGTAARVYTLQRTGALGSPAWTAAGTVTMDATGKAVFEDAEANKTFPLFYRAVAN